jgi:alkyl hydroperoxide reductase subunit AhpF
MTLLNDDIRQRVQKRLAELHAPVRLVHFTRAAGCEYSAEARQLLEEVQALSDRVTLEVFDLDAAPVEAARYGIDKVPATVVMAAQDAGIRYFGLPAGYEFGSLLETMHLVSGGDSGLQPATRARLAQLREPLLLEVFVTPT